ncbi:unnamed protein product [Thelazia callipaeda]|uniref:ABC transmembrane type-1 domain-containing protein n=1 Tax=Thelazia callipaeda TaxID=103827 RepID=A0A0N5CMW6_THECL|nr:unnamed protein product [Thelazia callipaeda]
MTADNEIQNIHWTLEKIHKALRIIDNEFELVIPKIDHITGDLKQILAHVTNQINGIRNGTVFVTSYFPTYRIYLLAFVITEIIAGILAIALIYYLILLIKEFCLRKCLPEITGINRKLCQNNTNDKKNKTETLQLKHTLSSTLSSSTFRHQKINKDWWIDMYDLDDKTQLHKGHV